MLRLLLRLVRRRSTAGDLLRLEEASFLFADLLLRFTMGASLCSDRLPLLAAALLLRWPLRPRGSGEAARFFRLLTASLSLSLSDTSEAAGLAAALGELSADASSSDEDFALLSGL